MLFTGIIEEIGTVTRIWQAGRGYHLTVRARTVLENTQLGDSIAINGTCLTVTGLGEGTFTVGLAPETRLRTNLLYLKAGHKVNLERALTPLSRMGGHFVQGHVDGVGTVRELRVEDDALWISVQAEPALMRYIVAKGFIALDGVSLTVVDVSEKHFSVMLVAYTRQHITLPQQHVGYKINIEVDVLGKYVENIVRQYFGPKSNITREFLAQHGY